MTNEEDKSNRDFLSTPTTPGDALKFIQSDLLSRTSPQDCISAQFVGLYID
jgi:hypothetical protein